MNEREVYLHDIPLEEAQARLRQMLEAAGLAGVLGIEDVALDAKKLKQWKADADLDGVVLDLPGRLRSGHLRQRLLRRRRRPRRPSGPARRRSGSPPCARRRQGCGRAASPGATSG